MFKARVSLCSFSTWGSVLVAIALFRSRCIEEALFMAKGLFRYLDLEKQCLWPKYYSAMVASKKLCLWLKDRCVAINFSQLRSEAKPHCLRELACNHTFIWNVRARDIGVGITFKHPEIHQNPKERQRRRNVKHRNHSASRRTMSTPEKNGRSKD